MCGPPAIEKLVVRYAPHDSAANRDRVIANEWTPLCMLEMTSEHITGKQVIELMKKWPENTPETMQKCPFFLRKTGVFLRGI